MESILSLINRAANNRLKVWRDYRMEGSAKQRIQAVRRLTLKLEEYWQCRRRERATYYAETYEPGIPIPSSLKAWLSRSE